MPALFTLCRRAALVLLLFVLCTLTALGGGLLWLRTTSGETFLRTQTQPLLNAALAESGLTLELASLSGPLPQALSVRGLTLQDVHGPWLTVAEATLIPDLAALLHGRIRILEIRITNPALLRLPDLPPSTAPENPDPLAFTRDLPAWLPATQIDALVVQDLTLPASLLDPAAAPDSVLHFDAHGSLAAPANTELSTTLRVTRTNGSGSAPDSDPSTELNLAATLRVPDQTLKLSLTAQDGTADAQDGTAGSPGLLAPLIPSLPTFRSLTLSLSGDAPVTSWSGSLDLHALGLGRVAGILGLTLAPDSRSLAVELTAEPSSDLPAPWPTALSGTRLTTAITLSSGSLRIPSLVLHIDGLDANLSAADVAVTETIPGKIDDNLTLSGTLSASIGAPQVLGALAPPLDAAAASFTLSGSLFTPTLAGDVTLTQLRLPNLPDLSPKDWSLAVTSDLSASGILRCSSEVASPLGGMSLKVEASGTPLTTYAQSGHVPHFSDPLALLRQLAGTLALQLNLPTPHLLIPAFGASPFALALDTTLDSAGLHLTASLPVLDLAVMADAPLTDLKLTASLPVPDPAVPLPLQISGSAQTLQGPASLAITGDVQTDRLTLSSLTAQLAGLDLSGHLTAAFSTPTPTPAPVTPTPTPTLDGQLHLRVADWAILAPLLPMPLSATSAAVDIRLVSVPNQTLDATLQLTELLLPETADLRIPSVQLQVKARDLFTTPSIEATVAANNGVLTGLQWQTFESRLAARLSSRPSLQFSLTTTGLVPDALTNTPPMNATVTASLPEGATALIGNLQVEGFGIEPASGTLTVPMLTREGKLLPAMDAPLSGSLQWKGALAPLWRLVPVANCRVRGEGLVDLQLGGTLSKPRPSGRILLENVLFQHLVLALELSHMRGEVLFSSEGTATFNAFGDGGRGGSFAFSGDIGTLEAQFPLNIKGSLTNMAPLLRRDLQFAVSGDVAVTGTAVTPDVWARLEVGSGELRVENLPGGGVTTLTVEVAGAPPPPPPGAVGRLDVGVTVPGRFFVRGHGIESEWKGNLEINGPLNTPAIIGQIASVRGTFTFLGKLFTLAKGQIDFNGAYPPVPTVDVQLAYVRQDFTAIIELLGPATSPRFNLTSQPRQPKDEIISQILFGSPKGGLGRAEALELAATLASLTFFGASGGGFLDVTRQVFGLDVLRVGAPRGIGNAKSRPSSRIFTPFSNTGLGSTGLGQQGSGSTSNNTENPENIAVELGKYVLDSVYVGLEQGMTESSTGVVVTIEVSPSVNLEARSNGKGTEVGATWSWEY